jgi:hypothetical protein
MKLSGKHGKDTEKNKEGIYYNSMCSYKSIVQLGHLQLKFSLCTTLETF